ncbi:unnamed protein product [Pedinophyceae sp. YPF-701]|nr:unnamed protein product [Pedinophyceae sp. YPF-701]
MGGAHEVNIVGNYGQIWHAKPDIGADGHVSVLSNRSWPKASAGPPVDTSTFCGVAMSPRGDMIATADTRGQIYLLRVPRNRYALIARTGVEPTAIAFSRRNKREIYVAFSDSNVRCYDVEEGQLLATLKGHRSPPKNMTMRATADELLTVSADGLIVWDMRNLTRKKTLSAGGVAVLQGAFTEDGTHIAAAFRDDSVWIWDADTFRVRHRIAITHPGDAARASSQVTCFALSPNSECVAIGTCHQQIHVYSLITGVLAGTLALPEPAAARGVVQMRFMPDDATVACLTATGALLFADTAAGRLTCSVVPPRGLDARKCDLFDCDGRGNYAAMLSRDGAVHLFDLARVREAQAGAEKPLARSAVLADATNAGAPAAADSGADVDAAAVQRGSTVRGHVPGGAPPPPRGLWDQAFPARADVQKWADTSAKDRVRAAPAGLVPGMTGGGAARAGGREPKRAGVASDPAAPQLSRRRLRELLDAFGEYPEKYRPLCWRSLLKLPSNREAFRALATAGIHPAFNDLGERYPLRDRTLLSRLARTLSAMAHWCPMFGEVAYMPALAFPLVRAFGKDELHCFEALATLVRNWSAGWFATFPAPPVALLTRLDPVLAHHDPELFAAFQGALGGCQAPAWALMSTLLSEVLSRAEWMKVFDHMVSNPPSFLAYAVLAYMAHFRGAIMAADSGEEVDVFVRRCNALDVNKLIQLAYRMRDTTPDAIKLEDGAFLALPPGDTYPPFTGYPKSAVDLHLAERERIRAEEEAIARRRRVVHELEERTRAMQAQEASWAAEKRRVAEVEAERRAALRRVEEEAAIERLGLDDRAKEERLKQVALVEAQYRANLAQLKEEWTRELEALRRDVEHKRKLADLDLRGRAEEEKLRAVEFAAQQRMWALDEEAAREAAQRRVRAGVEATRVADAGAAAEREREWAAEEEAAALQKRAMAEKAAKEAAVQAELAAAAEAAQMAAGSAIEGAAADAELERRRRLRRMAEAAAVEQARAADAERARKGALMKQDEDHVRARVEEMRRAAEEAGRRRADALAAATEARQREAAGLRDRADAVERAMRRRENDAQVDERQRQLAKEGAREEAALRALLAEIAAERARDAEAERELDAREAVLAERLAHARRVGEEEGRAEDDERARFQALREELLDRQARANGEATRQHEEVMARLQLEREKQLLELDTQWRRRVAREEMLRLEQEQRKVDDEAARGRAEAERRERELAKEVGELRRRAERMEKEAARAGVDVGRAAKRGVEECRGASGEGSSLHSESSFVSEDAGTSPESGNGSLSGTSCSATTSATTSPGGGSSGIGPGLSGVPGDTPSGPSVGTGLASSSQRSRDACSCDDLVAAIRVAPALANTPSSGLSSGPSLTRDSGSPVPNRDYSRTPSGFSVSLSGASTGARRPRGPATLSQAVAAAERAFTSPSEEHPPHSSQFSGLSASGSGSAAGGDEEGPLSPPGSERTPSFGSDDRAREAYASFEQSARRGGAGAGLDESMGAPSGEDAEDDDEAATMRSLCGTEAAVRSIYSITDMAEGQRLPGEDSDPPTPRASHEGPMTRTDAAAGAAVGPLDPSLASILREMASIESRLDAQLERSQGQSRPSEGSS